jgi:hypothetical protein
MVANSQYLEACWSVPPDGQNRQNSLEMLPGLVIDQRDHIIQNLVPEIIGFAVYAIIFGALTHISTFFSIHSAHSTAPSFLNSLICLYYLFKNRKGSLHATETGFSIVISSFNLAGFALKCLGTIGHVKQSTCMFSSGYEAFGVPTYIGPHSVKTALIWDFISNAYTPIFLWISDAFLVCSCIHSATDFPF